MKKGELQMAGIGETYSFANENATTSFEAF